MTDKTGLPPSYHDSQSGFQTGPVVGGFPQQGVEGYQPQGAGFPQQGAGGYLQHGAGGYPHGAGYRQGAGYPQGAGFPAGEYRPKSQPGPYGQPGYTNPGYDEAYIQQSTQTLIAHQPDAAGHVIVQPRPPNQIWTSIFMTIFCFCPTGLGAIYYATQANRLADVGDMAGATRMSNNARKLIIASIVIGIIWIAVVVILRAWVFMSYEHQSTTPGYNQRF